MVRPMGRSSASLFEDSQLALCVLDALVGQGLVTTALRIPKLRPAEDDDLEDESESWRDRAITNQSQAIDDALDLLAKHRDRLAALKKISGVALLAEDQYWADVSSLVGIEQCVGLEHLTLWSSSDVDLGPLAALPKLATLDLSLAQRVRDLAPLAQRPGLAVIGRAIAPPASLEELIAADDVEAVKRLVDGGVTLDAQSIWRALWDRRSAPNSGAILRLLLSRGLDPEATLAGGNTALEKALDERSASWVEALLSHGADPNRLSIHGFRTFERLRFEEPLTGKSEKTQRQNQQLLEENRQRRVVLELLLAHGLDPNLSNNWGDTLATRLVSGADALALQLALDAGADPLALTNGRPLRYQTRFIKDAAARGAIEDVIDHRVAVVRARTALVTTLQLRFAPCVPSES
jgi:hypothetical protein